MNPPSPNPPEVVSREEAARLLRHATPGHWYVESAGVMDRYRSTVIAHCGNPANEEGDPDLVAAAPRLAETVIELDIAINGDCGCPPPWDQCPHNAPLLPSLNNAVRSIERLAELARKAGASDRDIFIATYDSTVGAPS